MLLSASEVRMEFQLYVFQTDLLSVIRSLNTVFTAMGIYHTSYIAIC